MSFLIILLSIPFFCAAYLSIESHKLNQKKKLLKKIKQGKLVKVNKIILEMEEAGVVTIKDKVYPNFK